MQNRKTQKFKSACISLGPEIRNPAAFRRKIIDLRSGLESEIIRRSTANEIKDALLEMSDRIANNRGMITFQIQLLFELGKTAKAREMAREDFGDMMEETGLLGKDCGAWGAFEMTSAQLLLSELVKIAKVMGKEKTLAILSRIVDLDKEEPEYEMIPGLSTLAGIAAARAGLYDIAERCFEANSCLSDESEGGVYPLVNAGRIAAEVPDLRRQAILVAMAVQQEYPDEACLMYLKCNDLKGAMGCVEIMRERNFAPSHAFLLEASASPLNVVLENLGRIHTEGKINARSIEEMQGKLEKIGGDTGNNREILYQLEHLRPESSVSFVIDSRSFILEYKADPAPLFTLMEANIESYRQAAYLEIAKRCRQALFETADAASISTAHAGLLATEAREHRDFGLLPALKKKAPGSERDPLEFECFLQ